MDAPPALGPIVVRGRVLEPASYRPPTPLRLEDTVAWWTALGVLGGLLVLAGGLAVAQRGSVLAVLGVLSFLATAVVAGAERFEPATALGVAGVVLTSLGISLVLGTDPSILATALILWVLGGAGAATALLLGRRAWMRERSYRAGRPSPS